MIDRSFGSIYFLPCSNSLLGIATSHIGLIRSLYCSVFKEPSLFKRLDYLTTFISFCQMFFEIIFKVSFLFGLSICLCLSLCRATYEIISHLLLSVNWLFLRSFGLRLAGSWLKRVLLYQFDAAVSRVFSWSVFKKGRGFRVQGSKFKVQGSRVWWQLRWDPSTQVAAVLAFGISYTTFLTAQDDETGRCPKVSG